MERCLSIADSDIISLSFDILQSLIKETKERRGTLF